jgi:hypothetical protein
VPDENLVLMGNTPLKVKSAVLTLTPGATTSGKKSLSRTQADGPRLLKPAMSSVLETAPTAKLSGLLAGLILDAGPNSMFDVHFFLVNLPQCPGVYIS